jgi:hypothetical protein
VRTRGPSEIAGRPSFSGREASAFASRPVRDPTTEGPSLFPQRRVHHEDCRVFVAIREDDTPTVGGVGGSRASTRRRSVSSAVTLDPRRIDRAIGQERSASEISKGVSGNPHGRELTDGRERARFVGEESRSELQRSRHRSTPSAPSMDAPPLPRLVRDEGSPPEAGVAARAGRISICGGAGCGRKEPAPGSYRLVSHGRSARRLRWPSRGSAAPRPNMPSAPEKSVD